MDKNEKLNQILHIGNFRTYDPSDYNSDEIIFVNFNQPESETIIITDYVVCEDLFDDISKLT